MPVCRSEYVYASSADLGIETIIVISLFFGIYYYLKSMHRFIFILLPFTRDSITSKVGCLVSRLNRNAKKLFSLDTAFQLSFQKQTEVVVTNCLKSFGGSIFIDLFSFGFTPILLSE
jgi:hypothetical protein